MMKKADKKLAVLFPGIGYTCEKPLLYYAGKIAAEKGYEIKTVPYKNFPEKVKGNQEKMEQSFHIAMKQAEEMLKEVSWGEYGEILFISKSVGTIVSSAYRKKYGLTARNILFTPLAQTFFFAEEGGMVFHGTKDPWTETAKIVASCEKLKLPIWITENGNHSLETGDVLKDIINLEKIMEQIEKFI